MEEHRTLGCLRLVHSREVLERFFLDRTRPVCADRTLVRVQSINRRRLVLIERLVEEHRTLGCLHPVDFREVLKMFFLDQTRPVAVDRKLVRVRSELNGPL